MMVGKGRTALRPGETLHGNSVHTHRRPDGNGGHRCRRSGVRISIFVRNRAAATTPRLADATAGGTLESAAGRATGSQVRESRHCYCATVAGAATADKLDTTSSESTTQKGQCATEAWEQSGFYFDAFATARGSNPE